MGRAAACAGPYQTERQAAAAARQIYAAAPAVPLRAANRRLLEDACASAYVPLGDWDRRIVAWLAGWEPATCVVIAGLITRAARHHTRAAPAEEEPDGGQDCCP